MAHPGGRRLSVVAPTGYPWTFNGPRQSGHDIRIRKYLPINRLRSGLDGITAFSPLDTLGADLIHAFNRIPINQLPFVIGFESHLPRVFGHEKSAYERFLFNRLLSRCRRIVAISHYAAGKFRDGIASAELSADARALLLSRLEVRHPNLPVPADEPPDLRLDGEIVLTFVGNHFARKGGCSAVRMAQLALERRLPLRVNIVSTLQCGGPIWTDPARAGFFDRYRELLALPNVRHLANISNAEVKALLAQSHFLLLTTFSDTFGFSVLEAMAVGTPAIVTRQGALPEVVDDGISGILLDQAKTPGQPGWIWPFERRDQPEFETLFATEVERLAAAAVERVAAILDAPEDYATMRRAAYRKAKSQFDSGDAQRYWDALYSQVLDDYSERQTKLAVPAP